MVFHVPSSATTLGEPLFSAPGWDSVEAVPAVPARRAMGRLSMVDVAKRTGQVLCLDVNDTSLRLPGASPAPTVARVRVLAGVAPGKAQTIGEVAVQPDGSFMAEVPANLPLGFEARGCPRPAAPTRSAHDLGAPRREPILYRLSRSSQPLPPETTVPSGDPPRPSPRVLDEPTCFNGAEP